MRIFIDTEFTGFEEPKLLSIGLVAEDGPECYVELVDERLEIDAAVCAMAPPFGLVRAVGKPSPCRQPAIELRMLRWIR